VFLTRHAIRRIRERGISAREILLVLRHPCMVLWDTRPASLRGYRRRVYVSRRYMLIVVVEEDSSVVIVTSWRTTKDIDREVRKKIARGEWVEGA